MSPPFSAHRLISLPMHIGPYTLANNLFVAPMAGVTDRPFRMLCKQLGAGYAVSEMVTSRPDLRDSLKTSRRADHQGCLLYTSPSPRDYAASRMPSSA